MAETRDGTQGLAKKSTPVSDGTRQPAQAGFALDSRGLHPDGTPLKGGVFGRDERCSAFLCAFPPHPPNPLLPQGEKGEVGRPDG
jgi:hypothetical protein